MSSKTKHSKIRNTGILFELLTRQITVDVLNNDKEGSAANILKEFFNKKTQLGKEYELYKVLTTENYKSEIKANHLVDAVVKAHQKLNGSQLKREKYNLIKEIKKNYDVNDFFMARIPNYKVNASLYEIFAANLFEQIGILSPKTMFVDVQYGRDIGHHFSFEKIKEFSQ